MQQSAEAYIQQFLIAQFQPAALEIGYDHRFGRNRRGSIADLRRYAARDGFEIVEIQKQEVADIAVSSTKVRQALRDGDVKTAAQLLNHPFELRGTVVKGQQIGKTLGFPTANLQVAESHKLIPPVGIYAVRVHHRDQVHGAMLYIGNRPTLVEYDNRTIEVNIFDFDQDLYGQLLRVEFIDHIREDQHFEGLEALRLQLMKDEQSARAILSAQNSNS